MSQADDAASAGSGLGSLLRALGRGWVDLDRLAPLRWLTPDLPVRVTHADGRESTWVGDSRLPDSTPRPTDYHAVELPQDDRLDSRLRLPPMSRADLRAAVALQVQSSSPFDAADLVWGCERRAAGPTPGRRHCGGRHSGGKRMIIGDLIKGIFGDWGLTGGVMDVLKSTGILKDPEAALKAEEALRAYELAKGTQEIAAEQVFAQDRDSARKREIEVKDRTPRQIAWVSFIGFFAILIVLMFVDVPATAKDALLIMLGTLAGIVTSITAYYYGSSSGSTRKNEKIDRLLDRKE